MIIHVISVADVGLLNGAGKQVLGFEAAQTHLEAAGLGAGGVPEPGVLCGV